MKSMIVFLDKEGNIVEQKKKAKIAIIREIDKDGNIVNETFLRKFTKDNKS